ncbi:MAG TPA: plastocyanin/azurin family copper-binding protein [Polyangia bacterium]
MVLLALCGCGGNDNDNTSATTSVPATAVASNPVIVTVGAVANQFSPATVNIRPGDTVEWVWAGGPYTVTSGSPTAGGPDGMFCSLASGKLVSRGTCNSRSYAQDAGATFSWNFLSAGTFHYFSTVQGAAMSGTVVVGP